MRRTSLRGEIVPLLLTAAGIVLASIQFLLDRSLRIDEAALGLNIIGRSFHELLGTLNHNQVAPIGFLFVEKAITMVFGDNEMALRLFPFVSFLASIPLFYRLSFVLSGERRIALLAMAIFSLTLTLVYYASEVKQYMSDVLCTVLISYLLLKEYRSTSARNLSYLVTGVLALLFSNISVLILFAVGSYVLFTEIRQKRSVLLSVLLPMAAWVLTFLVYYYFFILDHPNQYLMVHYWRDSFMPLNPISKEFFDFASMSLTGIFGYLLGFGPAWPLGLLLYLAGILGMVMSRKWTALYILMSPLVIHLLISALHLYPFNGRLILYQAPFLILVIAIGSVHLFDLVNRRLRLPQAIVYVAALLFVPALVLKFPVEKEEMKKSIGYMEERMDEGDRVLVYYASTRAYTFYRETGRFTRDHDVIWGQMHREEPEGYKDQLSTLSGDVWLLFSHISEARGTDISEERYIVDAARELGAEVADSALFTGSSIYLARFPQ